MDAFLRFLIVWMSIGLSSATYIIDDLNTTVQYSPPGDWSRINSSSYYNGTITWTYCITSANCTMTIPFTGSGITLYMVQVYAGNFSVSIDGSTPMSFSFPQGSGQVNVTAYDKQALQSGSHILDLMLLNDTDTAGAFIPGYSEILFDYAKVNETNAFPTPAPTSNTVLPPTHTSASGHSGHTSVTSAAIGGTLGGIAVIVAGISIFVWILKANRSQPRQGEFTYTAVGLNDFPVELPVEVPSSPAVLSPPAMLPTTWQPAASSEKRDPTSTSAQRDVAQSTTPTSSALASFTSTSANPLPEEQAALLLRLGSFGVSPSDITRLVAVMNGHSESTVEDMQFIQRLYTLHVPAEDIKLVVAAMQWPGQNREAIQHGSFDGADISQFPVPPPSYS